MGEIRRDNAVKLLFNEMESANDEFSESLSELHSLLPVPPHQYCDLSVSHHSLSLFTSINLGNAAGEFSIARCMYMYAGLCFLLSNVVHHENQYSLDVNDVPSRSFLYNQTCLTDRKGLQKCIDNT